MRKLWRITHKLNTKPFFCVTQFVSDLPVFNISIKSTKTKFIPIEYAMSITCIIPYIFHIRITKLKKPMIVTVASVFSFSKLHG